MASNIDVTGLDETQPPEGEATTAAVRSNFAEIKTNLVIAGTEITALQAKDAALDTELTTLVQDKIHAADSKTPPVDADELGLVDSAASWGLKKLTWANLKATIKTYYDSVSSTLSNKTIIAADNTLDATLEDVAGLTPSDGSFVVGDGVNLVTESGATARTSLGLGTSAVEDTGTSGATVPLLSTANTWSQQQDFSANGIILNKGTFTPTIIGLTTAGVGTYVTQDGKYTEFDDCYHVAIAVSWTAHTGTGNMRISGLPFSGGTGVDSALAFGVINGLDTGTAGRMLTAVSVSGTVTIAIRHSDISTGGVTFLVMDAAVGSLALSGVIFK